MSYPQQFAEPDWQYDFQEACVPDFSTGGPSHQPGYSHYANAPGAPGPATPYVSQNSVPRAPSMPTFHVPIAPASALRHGYGNIQQHSQSSDSDTDGLFAKRTKRTRTACEECRKRKQKCDGGEPCRSCEEQSTNCKYRDVAPTKKDDSMERMIKLAEEYNKTLANLSSDLDVMNTTLRSIEARLDSDWRAASGPVDKTMTHKSRRARS